MSDTGLVLRAFVEADRPYICSTWLRSATLGEHGRSRHLAIVRMRPAMEAAMARGLIWCAVSPSQPSTVHGWICTELNGEMLYLFVPKDLKNQGIEALLFTTAAAQQAASRVA